MQRYCRIPLAMVFTLVAAHGLEAQAIDPVRICLAPASVEESTNAAAAEAVRATFQTFLTGPSLTSQPLQSHLVSQAREEAKQTGCPFILLTTVKVVAKRSGGGLLGRVVAGAARQGVAEAGIASGSTTGRIVGSAASIGLQEATLNYAGTIRNRDELTLGWRLEAADGKVLVEEKGKRSAKADGEDLLTPMIQPAAEKIVAAARRRAQ